MRQGEGGQLRGFGGVPPSDFGGGLVVSAVSLCPFAGGGSGFCSRISCFLLFSFGPLGPRRDG